MNAAQLDLFAPRARHSDPITSHEAAAFKRPSAERHLRDIRRWFTLYGPATQMECAIALEALGWKRSSTISACNPKRSGLEIVGKWRELDVHGNPHGPAMNLYALRCDTVRTDLV